MEQQRWGMSPQIQWEQAEREKENKRKKSESKTRLQEKYKEETRRLLKLKIETIVSLLLVAGTIFMLLTRTAGVYQSQMEYNDLVSLTRVTHKDNEDLRAKIMKHENITALTERAQNLPLVPIGEENTMVINLAKNNFKEEDVVTTKHWTDTIEEKVTEWYGKLL